MNLPLAGLRVGISGAVPERELWGEVTDLDRLILIFNSQLSGLIMDYGGQVVHGSQPTFAPVLAEEARRCSAEGTQPLKLVASKLWGESPEVGVRCAKLAKAPLLLTPKVGEGSNLHKPTRDDSLTAMRLVLTAEIDVLIAIGGKLHSDTGFNPGVLEELAQARWRDIPCFIVGAFGGVAGSLDGKILKQLSEGNGLSDEEVLQLARWSNRMDEAVGGLVVHLAKHRDAFLRKRKQPDFLSDQKYSTEEAPVDHGLVRMCSDRFSVLAQAITDGKSEQVAALLADKI
jgi:hypothetical protein